MCNLESARSRRISLRFRLFSGLEWWGGEQRGSVVFQSHSLHLLECILGERENCSMGDPEEQSIGMRTTACLLACLTNTTTAPLSKTITIIGSLFCAYQNRQILQEEEAIIPWDLCEMVVIVLRKSFDVAAPGSLNPCYRRVKLQLKKSPELVTCSYIIQYYLTRIVPSLEPFEVSEFKSSIVRIRFGTISIRFLLLQPVIFLQSCLYRIMPEQQE